MLGNDPTKLYGWIKPNAMLTASNNNQFLQNFMNCKEPLSGIRDMQYLHETISDWTFSKDGYTGYATIITFPKCKLGHTSIQPVLTSTFQRRK